MISYQSSGISDIGAFQYDNKNNYINIERFDNKFNSFFEKNKIPSPRLN